MKHNNIQVIEAYKVPVRTIAAEVAVKQDAETVYLFEHDTNLKSITLDRVGEDSTFYGFGVCQKVNVKVIDKERAVSPTTAQYLDIMLDNVRLAPRLYITQSHRDEITNELSITAYDRIYNATEHEVSELEVALPATIADYAEAAAELLGLVLSIPGDTSRFALEYENGANLDGTETIRSLLDSIAAATQTIYYIDINNNLVFQQLDRDGAAAYTIDKEQYFTLDSGSNRRLTAICHTTELGDNVKTALDLTGTTQYVRDNPFYELREDIAALVDAALANIGGITINQFDCEWRGNPAVEIGDKLAIETKDGTLAYTYLLNDTLTYDGALRQHSQWQYEDTGETESNPATLGETLNKTFARVDKVNKQIDIVAGETEANASNIAALRLNTESIAASVSKIEETTTATIEGVNSDIATLISRVDAAITADGVKLSIAEELAKGVDKVYTSTGFAFDADGLRVSKSGSEMETLLDEDGLSVFRDDVEVLTADNTGVNGINMTVRQYLIVGGSRFEAYGAGRTGCFWIGG